MTFPQPLSMQHPSPLVEPTGTVQESLALDIAHTALHLWDSHIDPRSFGRVLMLCGTDWRAMMQLQTAYRVVLAEESGVKQPARLALLGAVEQEHLRLVVEAAVRTAIQQTAARLASYVVEGCGNADLAQVLLRMGGELIFSITPPMGLGSSKGVLRD